jgi:transcriptional regulator with XRE-family HTH domain
MKLGEKLRYLRTVEGFQRGLGRAMTQVEVSRAMQRELRKRVSQAYLSQIENGARPHLSATTRGLIARFFKVHPGFLVDDPKGFDASLDPDLARCEGKLDLWLMQGARQFGDDAEVSGALMRIAGQKDSRGAVVLLGKILASPGLASRIERLVQSQKPTRHEPWALP